MAHKDAPFVFWLDQLTTQQRRALASQAGITGWAVRAEGELDDLLLDNDRAKKIYQENYVG